jgi:hypothetical protein
MGNTEPYAAPTPKVLYIHDDLSEYILRRHGPASPAAQLTRDLFAGVYRNPTRVVRLTLESQIAALVARSYRPFALAIGIGRAGERVARQLHARAGWFPKISRVDITREEDGHGGYNVVTTSGIPLAQQLPPLDATSSLAVVDDTVFSGLTMRAVLLALAPDVTARTQAFCLRAVAASLPVIMALCPISTGFAAPGRLLDEVSFINASGLVMRIGIRHPDRPAQAFFERPMWMHAWFPGYADEIIELCHRLNYILEPDGKPAQFLLEVDGNQQA